MGILQSSLICPEVHSRGETETQKGGGRRGEENVSRRACDFQMPLHYPRYTRRDYEAMPEATLDRLLASYGLPACGSLEEKRSCATGHFLWPSQLEAKDGGGGRVVRVGEEEKEKRRESSQRRCSSSSFQMPLHYPSCTKADYDAMPECRLDCLLRAYGLPVTGDAKEKRGCAAAAFLWV